MCVGVRAHACVAKLWDADAGGAVVGAVAAGGASPVTTAEECINS